MMHPEPQQIFRNPWHFLAFGFGSGISPIAPGTCGTLLAIPFYLCIHSLPVLIYAATMVAAFVFGVWICGKTSEDLGEHDHPGIVWDEFVGYWLTMFAIPFSVPWLAIGFVFFRFFDIVKPWPIRMLDKSVEGGFGIMIDDVIAALYAWLCLQLLVYFT